MITIKSVLNFVRGPLLVALFLIFILVQIVLLFCLHRKQNKWLIWVGVPSIITSIIFIILYIMAQSATVLLFSDIPKIYEAIINPFTALILNNFLYYGIILFVIGVIMIVLYIILNKIQSTKKIDTTNNKINETGSLVE